MLGAFRDRQQAHDTFIDLDHTAFPLGQLDSEGLCEAAHNVEDKREPFGVGAALAFLFVWHVFAFILAVRVLDDLSLSDLKGPEKERCESRVFLEGTNGPVCSSHVCSAKDLLKGQPAN